MIFCRFFLSHSAKKNVEESFCVSLNLEYRKSFSIRGVFHDILSKYFCLTGPKKIVHESFSISLISGIENNHALEW